MTQRTRLLLGANQYASYLASLTPLLWLRLREITGAVAANSGSGGSTLNGTIAGTTALAQAGKLGANEALDFDGATSLITLTNHAALANMTTQRWMCLVRPDTLGEGGNGRLFAWATASANDHYFSLLSGNNIVVTVRGDGGSNALQQTNNGAIAAAIGAWTIFFMDYDDTNVLGAGRRCRIWMATSGTVTQLTTFVNNTALTGNVRNQAGNLYVGNTSGVANTFDGLYDELLAWSGQLWTLPEIMRISQLAGILS